MLASTSASKHPHYTKEHLEEMGETGTTKEGIIEALLIAAVEAVETQLV